MYPFFFQTKLILLKLKFILIQLVSDLSFSCSQWSEFAPVSFQTNFSPHNILPSRFLIQSVQTFYVLLIIVCRLGQSQPVSNSLL